MGYLLYFITGICTEIAKGIIKVIGVSAETAILNEKLRAERKEIEDLIWDPNKYEEEW